MIRLFSSRETHKKITITISLFIYLFIHNHLITHTYLTIYVWSPSSLWNNNLFAISLFHSLLVAMYMMKTVADLVVQL